MYQCFTIFLFLMAFQSSVLAFKKVVDIQHWVTKKGLSVYFVAVPHLPRLDVRVLFAAGSAYDGNKEGLAALTNRAFGEGTRRQSGNQIASTFLQVGAHFDTHIGRDAAELSLRTLSKPKYLNLALKELVHVLTEMKLSSKAFFRIRNQLITSIEIAGQDPGEIAAEAFYKILYSSHPYAHDPLGSRSVLTHLTLTDLNRFYDRYYVAKNAILVLVGDVSRRRAEKFARELSIHLPKGERAPKLSCVKPLQYSAHHHLLFPTKQVAIIMGQLGIGFQNRYYFPLLVGNCALGGLPLESALFKKVRDQKGLAYSVSSNFYPLKYVGPFQIQLKTRVAKMKKALSLVRSTLNDFLRYSLTNDRLSFIKQYLIASFPFKVASNSDVASIVSVIAFYHLPLNYLDNYRENVDKVTTKQVKAAFDHIINTKRLTVVTVGPAL